MCQVRLDRCLFEQSGSICNPTVSKLIQQQAQRLREIHAAADMVKCLERKRIHYIVFAISSLYDIVSALKHRSHTTEAYGHIVSDVQLQLWPPAGAVAFPAAVVAAADAIQQQPAWQRRLRHLQAIVRLQAI